MKKFFVFLLLVLPISLSSQIITDGLIGYWPLDNDAIDVSDNQNDGVLNATSSTADRFNNPNSAISFPGNGSIDFGDVLDVSTSDFSICAWFKVNVSSSGDRTLVAKSDLSGSDSRYALMIRNDLVYVIFDYGPSSSFFWHNFSGRQRMALCICNF